MKYVELVLCPVNEWTQPQSSGGITFTCHVMMSTIKDKLEAHGCWDRI